MHYRCLAHLQIVIYNVSIFKNVSVKQWTAGPSLNQTSNRLSNLLIQLTLSCLSPSTLPFSPLHPFTS